MVVDVNWRASCSFVIGIKWYMFFTLTSSKYPNGERGERRRKMERKDVVSDLPMWIVMVDLEVDSGNGPEEDV